MKFHRNLVFSPRAIPILLLAGSLFSQAATFTWDGGGANANTSTAENWDGDAAPAAGSDLVFSGTSAIGTPITWDGLNTRTFTFDASSLAYTFSGAAGLQFVTAGVDSIANNSSNIQTFDNNIRLFFNGAKAFNANTADLSLSTVTFRADGMANGQINTLVLTGASDGTISGAINTSGTFSNTAAGLRNALTKTGTGTWELAGVNTYGGTTEVQNGTLTLSGNRTVNSGAITLANGGAGSTPTLNVQAGTFGVAGTFIIGNGGSNSIVNHSAGTISSVGGSGLLIGNGSVASTATYNLSGGSLTAGSIIMGVNNITTGGTGVNVIDQTGGSLVSTTLRIGRYDVAGNFNNDNTFRQSAGTATITNLGLGGNAADSASTAPVAAALTLTGGTFSATNFASLSAGGANTSVITIGGTADVTLPEFPTVRGSGSTATIHFDGGTLKPAAASTSYLGGMTNAYLTANGAKLDVAPGRDITVSQALENAASQAGTLTKLGAGVLTLTGSNSYSGATTISAGTLRIGAGGTSGKLGEGNVTNNGVLEFNRSNAMTVANSISGTGTIYQKGSGTTTLDPGAGTNTIRALSADGGNLILKSGTFETTGADPFNGAYNVGAGARGGLLTIDGATLNVGGGRSLKVGANANGNLDIKSGTVTANDLVLGHNGTSVGTQSGGSVTVTNVSHQDGGAGSSYTLSGGSLTARRIYNNTASASDFTLNLDGGTLHSATGTTNLIDEAGRGGAEITVLLGTGNTTIDTTASDATILRGMGDMASVAGAFTKGGSGTLTLAGNSTYTGTTTVSSGTLLVTGSLGNTAVSVGVNGTLGGIGGIGGSLHFDSLATLSITDILDPLTINGNVTFGSGFGFGNLTGFDVETVAPGTYTLLAGSDFNLAGVENVDFENAYTRADGKLAYFQNGSLQVVVIPEPSAFLLACFGLLALLRRSRASMP